MSKIKAFFWIVLVGFILIVFFSNLDFFLQPQPINLNFIVKNYSLPALPTAILFLFFFAAGVLVAYLSNLPERFRLRKTIKNLKTTIDSHDKEIERIRTRPKPPEVNSTPENP
ncbi:MAG: LapA family protein [Desulfobacterales bacterium]|nr:LapA family protein [Desulfobacterales bacterium]